MTTRQRILITGASAGLGAAMARDFAAKGRDLALCARRLDRLKELREELLAAHPGITVAIHELDVNDHARVFEAFHASEDELGGLDRVIVNAGVGKGQPIGTGRFDANLQTAQTNFTAVLAQCEAAVEIFRARRAGHLVVVASVSAFRGLRGNVTTYAASKAGAAALAEGIRADLLGTPIRVTTLYPGYIDSEMTARAAKPPPMMVSTEKGVRAMVRAIEAEREEATLPAWPWVPMGFAIRHLPLRLVARIT